MRSYLLLEDQRVHMDSRCTRMMAVVRTIFSHRGWQCSNRIQAGLALARGKRGDGLGPDQNWGPLCIVQYIYTEYDAVLLAARLAVNTSAAVGWWGAHAPRAHILGCHRLHAMHSVKQREHHVLFLCMNSNAYTPSYRGVRAWKV
jgi:hypothetical protein